MKQSKIMEEEKKKKNSGFCGFNFCLPKRYLNIPNPIVKMT